MMIFTMQYEYVNAKGEINAHAFVMASDVNDQSKACLIEPNDLKEKWAFRGFTCTQNIGAPRQYKYPKEELKYKIKDGFSIYIDTREQMPLVIDYPTEIKGLKFGDYAINDPENKCYIERKSISDFIGTMSGGYERFCREIERSIAAEANLIVLIERPLQECLSFQYLNYVSKKIKVTPEFVFFNVRELIQKYTNVQFLFVDGREECVRVMKRIFFSDKEYKKYDLQLMYDLKLL